MHAWAAAIKNNVSDVFGVRAELLEYRPFIPYEPFRTRSSSAWVMLAQSGVTRLAQIGWYEWSLNYRKVFVQYWNGSSFPITEFNPFPDGTYTEYKVIDQGNNMYFYTEGTLRKSVSLNWDPNYGEIGSEITNWVNQMPGDYGAQNFMWFKLMKRQGSGATWYNFAPNIVGTTDNAKWYASNSRSGMSSLTELVTADKRGDCA